VSPQAIQVFTLTVNEAPAITSTNSAIFTVGTAGAVTVTTIGFPTPTLTGTGALPAGVTFTDNGNGTATIGGVPAAGTQGAYPLTITAQNGVSPPATQAFTLTAGVAPQFTSGASTTFTAGTAGTFTLTTSGFPIPTLSESGALPAGVTFTSGGGGTATIAGIPAAGTQGMYPLTITAQNGMSPPATQVFTLTVNEAPAITSTNSAIFTVGTAGTFTVTTSGFPTPTLTGTGALPTGVTFTDNGNGTATIGGVPAAGTQGAYPLTITAQNGVSPPATQAFTLTAGVAPQFTSGASTTFTAGTAGTFTLTTSGFPAPTLSESGALPTGVTFTSSGGGTATIGGVPAAGTGGVYPLTITAQNGMSPPAVQAFSLTIFTSSGPAVSSWAPGRLDLFARGADNAIWQDFSGAGRWSGWISQGKTIVSSPAAVSWGPNRIDLFGVGSDGRLYHKYWTGQAWSGWISPFGAPPPGIAAGSGPAVSSWAAGRLDVFVRGADNAIWQVFFSAGRWSGWISQGQTIVSSPAVVSQSVNQIDLFGTGTDGLIYQKVWNGQAWSAWLSTTGRPPPGLA
jgi:hypothetical protein